MRRIAMFREDFLPYSQTFVYEELRLLERHIVDVFAWRRLNPGLFPHQTVHVGGLPLVVTFHGVDVTVLDSWARLLPHRWPYAWLAQDVLRRMTFGLCVSNEIRDRL